MVLKSFLIFVISISLFRFSFSAWAQGSDETPTPTPTERPIEASKETPVETPLPTDTAVPSVSPTATPDSPDVGVSRTGTPIPSSSSTSPQPSLSASPAGQSISPTVSLPVTQSENTTSSSAMFYAVGATVLGAMGFGIYKASSSKTNNKGKDDHRCDGIKNLLEQKKKELEEFARSWPEEKLREVVIGKVRDELSKNETVGKIIDTAEKAKAHYDKLKETIELLEKRLDLCMLSLPEVEKPSYRGTIIENSLSDKEILKNIEITKNYHLEDWLLNDVLVNKKQIEKIGSFLNDGPWYMHFWKEDSDDVIVVFKDKSFDIKFSDKSTWTEAINYGTSKGISKEQLDFKR